ncbi:hypothetical protein [Haloarcula montana]|uniref:hypothetical protein n=1 Tax=Haloarcula montana TaxID=3111776 RepID=UPI002D78AB1A|nr:hypothetical protein [Haloarcula sp. GH36]
MRQQAAIEVALHDTGGYDFMTIPQLHASEIRRFAEGMELRREQRQHAQSGTHSPEKRSQKQAIKAGQRAERQQLLDEINDDFGGG